MSRILSLEATITSFVNSGGGPQQPNDQPLRLVGASPRGLSARLDALWVCTPVRFVPGELPSDRCFRGGVSAVCGTASSLRLTCVAEDQNPRNWMVDIVFGLDPFARNGQMRERRPGLAGEWTKAYKTQPLTDATNSGVPMQSRRL